MAEENQVTKEPEQITKNHNEQLLKIQRKKKLVRGLLQSIVRREKQRREKNKCNWRGTPAE